MQVTQGGKALRRNLEGVREAGGGRGRSWAERWVQQDSKLNLISGGALEGERYQRAVLL